MLKRIGSHAAVLLALGGLSASAAETNFVLLGIGVIEADKHIVEFQQFDRTIPAYEKSGIRPALLDWRDFFQSDRSEEQLLSGMRQFHAIQLPTTPDGAKAFDEAAQKRAAVVGGAIKR
ncbi:MAG: hypothetical protein PHR35_04425 [Kiritimatiellae bacterium]|nr:hypothetical protein [Kiritimatiellia bacterium]